MKGEAMKLGATVRALSVCAALLSGALPAHALPFSVSVPATGARGATITSSLLDGGVSGLEAADIWVTFDSKVFSGLTAAPGSATKGFSVVAGTPESAGGSLLRAWISLATGDAAVDGVSGSLVDVSFLIRPDAPLVSSDILFVSDADSDYAIPARSGSVTVTLAPPSEVAEPVSSMLVGMGILALAAFRRRQE